MFTAFREIRVHTRTLSVIGVLAAITGHGWGAPSSEKRLDALRDGHTAVTKALIEAGAHVDAMDESGSSALMYAALCTDIATMRLLLDRGADPNHANNAGATALMWSLSDEAKVRLLLDRGARVDVTPKLSGRTPLLMSAGRPGAAAVVRLLLEKGADPKARDSKGQTTLMRATSSEDPQIFRLLADRGVDVNAQAGDKKFKFTALAIAASVGNREMISMLQARGADSKFRNDAGFTTVNYGLSFRDFSPDSFADRHRRRSVGSKHVRPGPDDGCRGQRHVDSGSDS